MMFDGDPYTIGLMVGILLMQFANAGAILRLSLRFDNHCKFHNGSDKK